MARITTNILTDVISPAFDEIFMRTYNGLALPSDLIFKTRPIDTATWSMSELSGLGSYELVQENNEIPLDTLRQGYDKTFTPKKFGKAISFSYEFIDDIQAKYADVRQAIPAMIDSRAGEVIDMAKKAKEKKDALCAEIFVNANSSTGNHTWGGTKAIYDGVALVSDSHPINPDESSTVLDNKSTTALSHDALETFIIQMNKNMKDMRGEFISGIDPSVILVPPELEFTALRIMDSPGRPDSANNDINNMKGRFQVKVWRRLTDTNDWFLVAPGVGLEWLERKGPSFRYVDDAKVEAHNFYSSFRGVPIVTDWRGVWGAIV